jgi:riboflavin kinase/FMN adenylyltransferase
MEIFSDFKQITEPFMNAVVTIGNFDGVHIGHQALLRQVVENAHRLDGTSLVITFEPHPVRAFNPNNSFPLLTSCEEKAELIGATGIDVLVCIPFTREFAATPAPTFVKRILCETIGMRVVIVGPDHRLGRDCDGDISLLKEMSSRFGFEVIVSDWIESGAHRISSTRIRNMVREGRVEEAAEFLGRQYQMQGTVIHGEKQGVMLLGFPTANLKLDNELCPKEGVYAVTVECNGTAYKGVINIGQRPTSGSGKLTAEVYILDFDHDIYGCPIRVNFVRRLRDENKYSRPEELGLQIFKDVQDAREILSDHGNEL